MQNLKIFTLIQLFIFSANQDAITQNIKVISNIDKSDLPYATITNHTHPSVISSDRNGLAKPAVVIGDNLSVTYVGYKTARFRFNGDTFQIISLQRDQHILPQITIRNCRKTNQFLYTNYKSRKELKTKGIENIGFSAVVWSKGENVNAKIAVRLNPLKSNASLSSFSFWLEKEQDGPPSSVYTPLQINFFEILDNTNLPGELIVNEPVFYFPVKDGKQTIHLDSFHIQVPSNGIYVSLQYIMNEENEWKHATKWRSNTPDSILRDTVITRYGCKIMGMPSRNFDIVWYNEILDEWISLGNRPIPNDDFHSSIKCEAVIRYCSDE